MQGAGVKQTRSVCSPRARAAAAGRSRCVFAKQIRGFSAQSLGPKQMRCRLSISCPCPRSGASPRPRRIELCAGRGRKENAAATQGGTHFPDSDLGGNPVPEYRLRLGRSFRTSRKRKLRPGIHAQTGTRLPPCLLNSKTRAPSITKLGRRRPKRNRRRST